MISKKTKKGLQFFLYLPSRAGTAMIIKNIPIFWVNLHCTKILNFFFSDISSLKISNSFFGRQVVHLEKHSSTKNFCNARRCASIRLGLKKFYRDKYILIWTMQQSVMVKRKEKKPSRRFRLKTDAEKVKRVAESVKNCQSLQVFVIGGKKFEVVIF